MSLKNVAFPLRLRKVDKKEVERRVLEVLKMVQLEGFEKRSIRKLSGGQRQRVCHLPVPLSTSLVWSSWMSLVSS